MTKRQALRYQHLLSAVEPYGLTWTDLGQLIRCSRVLSTWGEHEANGAIQRDETTNIPYWHHTDNGRRLSRTADREAGAVRRARTIAEAHGLNLYYQTDPRGCALYLLRPGDVPEGQQAESCYNRGIAVTID